MKGGIVMKRLKKKKAFTIMELLIAVAIIIVLLAISMPFVAGLSTNLKMTELDNYAKTIFLEAQNQMIAKKAEGGLSDFYTEMETAYFTNKLDAAPQDFDVAANGDRWKDLYYLCADDSIVANVIPEGYAFDGSYLIELNPQTGDIYGVFYHEDSEGINYSVDVQSLIDRSMGERKHQQLGYYGGDLGNTALESFSLGQEVEVINSEELYIKITYELSSMLLRHYTEALEISVKIAGASAVWNYPVKTEDIIIKADKMELYILLDSMIPGYSFKEITSAMPEGSFTPGENLTITVASEFKKGSYHQADTHELQVNSLFSSYNGGEICIGAVRHLRNLDKNYYTHDGSALSIIQNNDIDFDTTDYKWVLNDGKCVYSDTATRAITVFEPIENDTVFENGNTTFDGRNNIIKNFVISTDSDNTGLIRQISDMEIKKVKLVDMKLDAGNGSYVGAFAGRIAKSTISDCGVYLSTKNADNAYYCNNFYVEGVYLNEMDERYDTRTVAGRQYVGGFCGYAKNVDIYDSFAAVKVKGTFDVGGFCGYADNGTTITDSYSSGAVTADGRTGGFVGSADNVRFKNCYSTSNIAVNEKSGGFVGKSDNSTYIDCISYAKLTDASGSSIPVTSGAFVGVYNSSGDSFDNCLYLKQEGYNVGLMDAAGIGSKYYYELTTAATPNEASRCFPYDSALIKTAFPFKMVTDSHYGNWPGQYVIDTSFVYYEVYEDNTYGYYCVTTVSDIDGNDSSNLTWVLDTLKDEICIEDGYALLTIYNLESFDYELNVGSVISTDSNYAANVHSGKIFVSNQYGDDKAKLLRQQSALTFKGYEGRYTSETDFSSEEVKNSFSVSGMYLYQLPYSLQTTDRAGVSNFYDRLIIYNGLAKNNPDPVIGGADKSDTGALTFYYCPHFSKNAVNPGVWNGTEKLANPIHVYIRSARQLNALGRYTYYWNTNEGYTDKILFEQETDISFSAYTNNYCGKAFDLMDTSVSNPVRNEPIGQPIASNSPGQFNNSFDGNCNKIIDYRVESGFRFVGFFGEVENGIIENIVLTVSAPGMGYIHSTYNESDTTAVGAVVGLSYHTNNKIKNCSASGYEVKYISGTNPKIKAISVGGLVGNSMSLIENCSATCDVRVELNGRFKYSISLGGLVGTAYYNSTRSSYTGGTIDITISNDADIRYIKDFAAGGIAGAVSKTYNKTQASNVGDTIYEDLYSYTTIMVNPKYEDVGGRYFISPIVAREVLSGESHHVDAGCAVTVEDIIIRDCAYLDSAFDGIKDDGESVANTEITSAYGAIAISYDELENLPLAQMGNVNDMDHTFPISIELKGRTYNFPATVRDKYNQYVHYGDWPAASSVKLLSKAMPGYYEIYSDGTVGSYYVDANGNVKSTLKNDVDIIETGYATIKLNPTGETPIGNVSISGVTYYVYKDAALVNPENKINIPYEITYDRVLVEEGVVKGDSDSDITRTLYVNPNFGAAISATETLGYEESNPLQVRTIQQFANVSFVSPAWDKEAYMKQTKDLKLDVFVGNVQLKERATYDGGRSEGFRMLDAANRVFDNSGGTIKNVWAVGSKDMFIGNNWGVMEECLIDRANINIAKSMAIVAEINNYIIRNCYVKNSNIAVNNYNAAGFVLTNATNGTIENCAAYSEIGYGNMTVSGNQAFGFVQSNGGTIKNCFATGTMNGANVAAGFVQANKGGGIIENCYANCINTTETGNAFGFVESNGSHGSAGRIARCYSAGSVKTSVGNYVYGFGYNDGSEAVMSDCYSICKLEPGSAAAYGFCNKTGTVKRCFWGYSDTYNTLSVNDGYGTKKTLLNISGFTESEIRGFVYDDVTAQPYDTTLGTLYPYPSLSGLTHYGNWP